MTVSDAVIDQLRAFHPSNVEITENDLWKYRIKLMNEITDTRGSLSEDDIDYKEIAEQVEVVLKQQLSKEEKVVFSILRAIENSGLGLIASQESYGNFDFYLKHHSKKPDYYLALYTQENGLGVTVTTHKKLDLKEFDKKLRRGAKPEKHFLINYQGDVPSDEQIEKMLEEEEGIADLNEISFEKALDKVRVDTKYEKQFNELVAKYGQTVTEGGTVPSQTSYFRELINLHRNIFEETHRVSSGKISSQIISFKSEIKKKLKELSKQADLCLNAKFDCSVSMNITNKEQIVYMPLETPISVKSYNAMLDNMKQTLPLFD